MFEPYGYGWFLVLKHKDGFHTCYAHLNGFPDFIRDAYRTKLVSEGKSFGKVMFSEKEVPVKKGSVVAYTGETGAGPAHLHFEIRDTDFNPVNPGLAKQLRPSDSAPPLPRQVSFVPMDATSSVNGKYEALMLNIIRASDGTFYVSEVPDLRGNVGLMLRANDSAGGAQDYPTPFDIEMFVDGRSYFDSKFDWVQQDKLWSIRIDRDHKLMQQKKGEFRKLFVEEWNKLPVYSPSVAGSGILSAQLGLGKKKLEIVCKDESGNTSHVYFFATFISDSATRSFRKNAAKQSSRRDMSVSRSESFDQIIYTIKAAAGFSKEPVVRVEQNGVIRNAELLRIHSGEYRAVVTTWPEFSGAARTEIRAIVGSEEKQWSEAFTAFHISAKDGGHIFSPDGKMRVDFTPGQVYRSMLCHVEERCVNGATQYVLSPSDVPLQGSPAISIRNEWKGLGAFIRAEYPGVNLRCSRDPETSSVEEAKAHFSRFLGTFSLLHDTQPPLLSISVSLGSDKPVRITTGDSLSGVQNETLVARIDGNVVPLEFSERIRAFYIPADVFKASKGKHLSVTIRDSVGNEAKKEMKL